LAVAAMGFHKKRKESLAIAATIKLLLHTGYDKNIELQEI